LIQHELSFEEIVILTRLPHDENTIFTITYSKGQGHHPQGQLVEGDSVRLKDGMVFNVTPTNRS